MINYLIDNKNANKLIILHLIIGGLTALSSVALIIWYYSSLVLFAISYFKNNNRIKSLLLLYTLVYFSSFELISRMAKTSPWIPYEMGKYFFLIIMLVGIRKTNIKSVLGLAMILCLIPSLFIDNSNQVDDFAQVVFNFIGPFNLALSIIYFRNIVLTKQQLINVLRLIILAVIPSLFFTILKTPSYDEIEFSLSANFNTSGGFGSNQVSTYFGVAFFILSIAWYQDWKILGSKLYDGLFSAFFLFQGVMTFSRGGVLVPVLVLLFIFYLSLKISKAKFYKSFIYIVVAVFLSIITFVVADNITNGMLTLRYQGETAGTLSGSKEQTLNTLTTNRFDIFMGDIELWKENPILGVGIGASRYLRNTLNGVVAHVEFSRLLAEHGFLGIIFFLLLISIGIVIVKRSFKLNNIENYFLMGLFIIALLTTFHAAMRTIITPLLVGLSLLKIRINPIPYVKNKIMLFRK